MTLKLKLDSAPDPEETIKLADLYEGSDEDGWTLRTADAGGLIVADEGISGKIGEARERASSLERKLKQWEKLQMSPKDVAAALEEANAIKEKGDPEQIAEEKLATIRQQIAQEFESETQTLQERVKAQSDKLKQSALDRALDSMLDGDPNSGIPPALGARRNMARQILRSFVSAEETEEGDYTIKVVDESGSPRLVPRTGDPMSPTQLWAEFSSSEQGSIFAQGSGNTGGPSAPATPANGTPLPFPVNETGQMLVPSAEMNSYLPEIGEGKAIVDPNS